MSRRLEWVKSMGVATGCGCKEVYRLLILLIPTPLVYVLFLQQHPYFSFIFLCFSFLFQKFFCNCILCIKLFFRAV